MTINEFLEKDFSISELKDFIESEAQRIAKQRTASEDKS